MSNLDRLRQVLADIGLSGPDLDWEIVTMLLKARRLTISSIAFQCGFGMSSLAQTKYRHQPEREAAIADALGVTAADLWPSRYPRLNLNLRPNPGSTKDGGTP